MKAILRSINNFSCKLKQSNNLKYNISPKIRSNKFKSISGNGNITIEDAIKKDLKDYKVYGNTYQNSTSGKNICLQANIIDTNTIRFDINSNEINRTFTLSLIPPLSVNSMSIVAFADGVNLRSVGTINLISGERSTTTITLTESIYNTIQNASEVHFNLYKSGAGISTTSIIEESQIENNSSFTSYEPYTGGQPSPSPEFNQKIISCGDKTKNLFLAPDTPSQLNLPTYSKNNKNSFTLYYNQTTTSVKSPYVRIDFDITQFKPNTRYTISKKYTVSGDNFRNVGAIRSYINGSNGSVVNSDTFSFTTPNEISSLGVYFYLGYENRTVGESQITFYDIQIEENSSATPYEPYGYKIPVNVRSENLFDKNNITLEKRLDPNGAFYNDAGYYTTSYIEVAPNTQYVKNSPSENAYHRICFYDTNKSFIIASNSNVYTTPSNAKYIRFCGLQTELNNAMYVTGSTAPSKYIPYYNETTNIYLDEPLRKIDGYSDYIDFINGKIVRQLGEVILDGSENEWYNAGGNAPFGITIVDALITKSNNELPLIYCDSFTKVTERSSWSAYSSMVSTNNVSTAVNVLRFRYTSISGLNNFKTWLQSNNVTVDYVLDTPTEENIELPNINLIEGKNIISIGTEVQGVFETEYYSKEIIDISNYKYNLRKVED